jgi:hypothetical protein
VLKINSFIKRTEFESNLYEWVSIELSNELVHLHLYPLDSNTTTFVKNYVYSFKKKMTKNKNIKVFQLKTHKDIFYIYVTFRKTKNTLKTR